jgi:hypothetical protein
MGCRKNQAALTLTEKTPFINAIIEGWVGVGSIHNRVHRRPSGSSNAGKFDDAHVP